MKLLSILGVTSAILVLQCSLIRGQSLTYDEDGVEKYARITQMLRKYLSKSRGTIQSRVGTLSTDILVKKSDIEAKLVTAITKLSTVWEKMAAMHLTAHKILTPMTLATMTDTYTNANLPLYGVVKLDHAMSYDGATGKVIISFPGIYMLEFKVQTVDYGGVYSKIEVTSAAGTLKYNILTYHDWEISPFYEAMNLAIGDVVHFRELSSSSSSYAHEVTGGSATQFHLRYLGKFVPQTGTTAGAAADETTTPWWWG